jgi:prepilin-type N-terminal cleavage/methylation domain-containing protein
MPGRNPSSRSVHGLTLVELLAVIAIIGLLVALLMPALQSAREVGRRVACGNKLRQMALAVGNFCNAQSRFPVSAAEPVYFTHWNVTFSGSGALATYGGILSLMPYLEQKAAYDDVISGMTPGTVDPTGRGWIRNVSSSSRIILDVLTCPSDGLPLRSTAWYGLLNYRMNGGDIWWGHLDADPLQRGPFRKGDPGNLGRPRFTQLAHVIDGLSNTVMLGEALTGSADARLERGVVAPPPATITMPSTCMGYGTSGQLTNFATNTTNDVAGNAWASDRVGSTVFFTIQPPNSIRCAMGTPDNVTRGKFPVSSLHGGGAFVTMCDGAVRFITDAIDTGTLAQTMATTTTGPSKWGVWGSLGSMAGREGLSIE